MFHLRFIRLLNNSNDHFKEEDFDVWGEDIWADGIDLDDGTDIG
jgi:hypothetical protein